MHRSPANLWLRGIVLDMFGMAHSQSESGEPELNTREVERDRDVVGARGRHSLRTLDCVFFRTLGVGQ